MIQINTTLYSNGYYPINLSNDEDVNFARKCICIMFIVQMGLVLLLRMISVFYNKCCIQQNKDSSKQQKDNQQRIVRFDSGVNLHEKIQDNFVNAKMNQKIENGNEKEKEKENSNKIKEKIKVVELKKQNPKDKNQDEQPKKQLTLNNRELYKLRKISEYGQKNLKNYLPKVEPSNRLNKKPSIEHQSVQQAKQENPQKKGNKNTNIFQFESTNQFLSNNEQSQTQQTETAKYSQVDQSSYNDPEVLKRGRQCYVNNFISIKNLKFTVQQFSTTYNLLISHSFIAFAVAHLYFPYFIIVVAAFSHILFIVIIIVINMVNNGNFCKYGTRICVTIIYIINLTIIGVSIFGIARSNQLFYNNFYQL